MWMCDGCEEINDDNIGTCTRCGRPYEPVPVIPTPAAPLSPGIQQGYQSTIKPQPNYIALYAIIFVIILVNLLPLLLYGLSTITGLLGVASSVISGIAAYNLWKQADLFWRGVKVEGTVTFIDFVPDNNNRGFFYGSQTGRYYTHASYIVNSVPYEVQSEYSSYFQAYEVGMPVTVWYDPADPNLSVLGSPKNYQPVVALLLGIGMTILAYYAGSSFHGAGPSFR
jgi:hypothetical protein